MASRTSLPLDKWYLLHQYLNPQTTNTASIGKWRRARLASVMENKGASEWAKADDDLEIREQSRRSHSHSQQVVCFELSTIVLLSSSRRGDRLFEISSVDDLQIHECIHEWIPFYEMRVEVSFDPCMDGTPSAKSRPELRLFRRG